jgi:hypothetical protein
VFNSNSLALPTTPAVNSVKLVASPKSALTANSITIPDTNFYPLALVYPSNDGLSAKSDLLMTTNMADSVYHRKSEGSLITSGNQLFGTGTKTFGGGVAALSLEGFNTGTNTLTIREGITMSSDNSQTILVGGSSLTTAASVPGDSKRATIYFKRGSNSETLERASYWDQYSEAGDEPILHMVFGTEVDGENHHRLASDRALNRLTPTTHYSTPATSAGLEGPSTTVTIGSGSFGSIVPVVFEAAHSVLVTGLWLEADGLPSTGSIQVQIFDRNPTGSELTRRDGLLAEFTTNMANATGRDSGYITLVGKLSGSSDSGIEGPVVSHKKGSQQAALYIRFAANFVTTSLTNVTLKGDYIHFGGEARSFELQASGPPTIPN